MSKTCLSVVSETTIPTEINAVFNGPSKNISSLPDGSILETVMLENFGIQSGEYCADPICLDLVTSEDQICALILHECQSGKMIDYQFPPQGIDCDEDGKIWINMSCWKAIDDCPPSSQSDLDPFLQLVCDPCQACLAIEALILKTTMKEALVSWSFAGKSITLKNPNVQELYKLLCIYQERCQDQVAKRCGRGRILNSGNFIPDC